MGNLDDAIAELKAINSRLAEMSELIQAIRKDLWNIKNIVADENIQNKIVQKGVERALGKAAIYVVVSTIMLYIIGKFLL